MRYAHNKHKAKNTYGQYGKLTEKANMIFYSYFSHTTETLDIRLATSRDGINFDRYVRKPLIPNGEEYDRDSLYAAAGIHTLSDGRQCIFYSGSNRRLFKGRLHSA